MFDAIQTMAFSGQPTQQANTSLSEQWYKTKKYSYKWTIVEFSGRPEKTGERFKSPTFPETTPDEELYWSIGLYPRGSYELYRDKIAISVGLEENKLNASEVRASFQLSIVDRNGKYHQLHDTKRPYEFAAGLCWVSPNTLSRYEIFNNKTGLLNGDNLTIVCEIVAHMETMEILRKENHLNGPANELPKHLEQLLGSEEFSDLTLTTSGKQFKVHKAILAARWPWFKEQLDEETKEFELADISPEMLEMVLRFIYTGEPSSAANLWLQDDQQRQLAIEVFKISDKYKLDGLKSILARDFSREISVDSAGELLLLADSHNAPEFKRTIINFIRDNHRQVFQTKSWISSFKRAPDELIAEINKEIFSEKPGE